MFGSEARLKIIQDERLKKRRELTGTKSIKTNLMIINSKEEEY